MPCCRLVCLYILILNILFRIHVGGKTPYQTKFSFITKTCGEISCCINQIKSGNVPVVCSGFKRSSALPCFCLSSHNLSINSTSLIVYLGRESQGGSNPNEQSRTVTQMMIHPSYHSVTNENNICLLKLASPVNFTSYVQPVCLAAAGSAFYSGTNMWVAGWGDLSNGGRSHAHLLF